MTSEHYDEDEIYAFNFHRSAGSFDYPSERKIIRQNYNPNDCPLFTNVEYEDYLKIIENN